MEQQNGHEKWKLNEENQKFDKGAQLWNHKTNNNQICT
jgi:hypothetical protein